MGKQYFIYFDDPRDQIIRATLSELAQRGYPGTMASGADGETWYYQTDREIDQTTRAELNRAGVRIIEK